LTVSVTLAYVYGVVYFYDAQRSDALVKKAADSKEPKETISIRISPEMKRDFEEYVLDFNTGHFTAGASMGLPQVTTVPLAYRQALAVGLAEMRKHLPKKGGRRG
jgi:hypothetical protein